MNLKKTDHIMDFFKVNNFAAPYLNTYYKKIDPDELAIAKFLTNEYTKIKDMPRALEIGCGPTIHHQLPAAPFVSSILMADYLWENLHEISKWLNKDSNAHNWNKFTRKIMALENVNNSNLSIVKRENLLRDKIEGLVKCNLLRENPLGNLEKFKVVSAFYCAEEVGIHKNEWRKVMFRISSLIEKDGFLFMSALRNTDFYKLVHIDGTEEIYPSANINEDDFYELLPKIGFNPKKTKIEIIDTPSQRHHGVPSILLISAQKY